MFYTWMDDTPVGRLLIAGNADGLKHVSFSVHDFSSPDVTPGEDWELSERPLREAVRQLGAYFRRRLTQFDLPLAADGTAFQKTVWRALCNVPYGTTASYGDIAIAIGQPTASRAVGLANGRNPLAIVVPCHRIIGRSGSLVGYGGGLDHKQSLLELEGVTITRRRLALVR
jgi:methylated-DNA-[protein]-cysteine S-methyltransferase